MYTQCGISIHITYHTVVCYSAIKENGMPGVVMDAYNLSYGEARQKDYKFEASQGYITRPHILKNKVLIHVQHS
jgi:hypothetical protein